MESSRNHMRVAIASGKGGTGKTTVAVNLALTAARAGQPVHLCDCDVEEPNAHLFLAPNFHEQRPVTAPIPRVDEDRCTHCGECAEICEFQAIACLPDRTLVFPELCHGCSGCWLVCPNQAITQDRRLLGEVATGTAQGLRFTHGRLKVGEVLVPPLIAAVKAKADGAPWAVFDAPPGTACPVIETLRDVDYAVLVAEPTPFGLHDLALAAALARALGRRFGVVVNKAVEGRSEVDRYCAREGIDILARIPFRRRLAEACAEGALAIDVDTDVAAAIAGLFAALREQEVPA
jgi:MinD superfamily P-loop ATPase